MRCLPLLLSLLVSLGAMASSASAASLDGSFHVYFGGKAQNAHPCAATAFVCGTGTIAGRAATTEVSITGFTHDWDANGCLGVTFDQLITLADGSGSLTLAESGDICAPSGAAAYPSDAAVIHTFGAPYWAGLHYVVAGASGVLAGLAGSGNVSMRTAGESGSVRIGG